MNVKLLRKVKQHILAEPKRFYMPWFIVRKVKENPRKIVPDRQFPRCGTVGCIAGWTCLLAHGMKFNGDEYFEAKRLLGLDKYQAERLFSMYSAPYQFSAIYKGDGKKKTADKLAERIDHFIKTKGAE